MKKKPKRRKPESGRKPKIAAANKRGAARPKLEVDAAKMRGGAQQWNPTTEPARSVKRVLIETGARVEVLPERTIGDLGLSRFEVQVAMNTEFFAGTDKRLSEEQCGESVLVLTLVGSIIDLQDL